MIDINCDMGESYGAFKVGNDEAIMPHITSTNIACGFHGGDPVVIEKTIQLAIKHNVRIGAHPGYPDLAGFGRRRMQISAEELKAIVKYQVSALSGMAASLGSKVSYVKPHGALYNTACDDIETCEAIIQAINETDKELPLMGLAGSLMEETAENRGIAFIAEAFADRTYEPDGKLMSRKEKSAVIHDPEKAAAQVFEIASRHRVRCSDESYIPIRADSVCIHGDNPSAINIILAIKKLLNT